MNLVYQKSVEETFLGLTGNGVVNEVIVVIWEV